MVLALPDGEVVDRRCRARIAGDAVEV